MDAHVVKRNVVYYDLLTAAENNTEKMDHLTALKRKSGWLTWRLREAYNAAVINREEKRPQSQLIDIVAWGRL